MIFTADFETTTDINDCRVWAYGLLEINKHSNFIYGNNMPDFISYFKNSKKINTAYIHNLKFDSEFIMSYLFNSGFSHVENRKQLADNTFTTLISDKAQFYTMTICFKKHKHKPCKLILIDSLKIIPMSIDKIAQAFGMKVKKLEIDYNKPRPAGYQLDKQEIEYLYNDVLIPAIALETLFNQGLDKMTLGSNALKDYKCIIGEDQFNKFFPKLEYEIDQNMRKDGYRGGYCF